MGTGKCPSGKLSCDKCPPKFPQYFSRACSPVPSIIKLHVLLLGQNLLSVLNEGKWSHKEDTYNLMISTKLERASKLIPVMAGVSGFHFF